MGDVTRILSIIRSMIQGVFYFFSRYLILSRGRIGQVILWPNMLSNRGTSNTQSWQHEKVKYLKMALDEKLANTPFYSIDDVKSWHDTAPSTTVQTPFQSNEDLNKKVGIWKGDITKLNADAIVNAANCTLLGGGGVDGAIHRRAGSMLLKECRSFPKLEEDGYVVKRLQTGEAVITGGYRLPAKYVIHTAGPSVYGELTEKDTRLLSASYTSSMQVMKKHNESFNLKETRRDDIEQETDATQIEMQQEKDRTSSQGVRELCRENTEKQSDKRIRLDKAEKKGGAYAIESSSEQFNDSDIPTREGAISYGVPIRSIAFPCISTGVYGYPQIEAAHVVLKTVRTWMELPENKNEVHQLNRIVFCLFLQSDVNIYNELMSTYFPQEKSASVEDSVTTPPAMQTQHSTEDYRNSYQDSTEIQSQEDKSMVKDSSDKQTDNPLCHSTSREESTKDKSGIIFKDPEQEISNSGDAKEEDPRKP